MKIRYPDFTIRPTLLTGILLALALIALLVLHHKPGETLPGTGSGPEYALPFSDAMASLQFMNTQRAYPENDIPDAKYGEAFEQVQQQILLARTRGLRGADYTEPDPWQPIGPMNVGGRTISLAVNPVNPQTIYAGAASGGVWRTYTGGRGVNAWHYIETGFPVLGVNAIAIDPSDTSRVYIGTGEVYGKETSIGGLYIRTTRGSYGIGILSSDDGGATWAKSLDWSYDQRRGVLALEIDPTDNDIIFAGTSEGVYRSTDRGGIWTRVLDVYMAVDIAINPVSGDTVYASCGNLGVPSDAGIYRSVDGGDTWAEMTNGLPDSWTGKTLLDIYATAPNVVYADVANALSDEDPTGVGLYRSLDSGESWEELTAGYPGYHNIARYQGWFSHFVVVHPADSSLVMVSGVDTYRSSDGGRTFVQTSYWNNWNYGITPVGGPEGPPDYSHADHHNFARHPTDPYTIYLATDGGIFITDDFGATFSGHNGGYQTTQFYGGFSSSLMDPDLAMGGLQDNSTVVYRGGPAWQRTLGGDGGFTALFPGTIGVMLASTQYGRIYKSFDGGDSWSRMNSEMEGYGDVVFVAPLAQATSNRSILYAGRVNVWRSDDGAENWYIPEWANELDGNPVLSLAISPLGTDLVWAATAPAGRRAGVFRTVNGGISWQNVTHNLPDRYPVDITADYREPNLAYVVFSGFGTSHLFMTENGGTSWTDIGQGLPDLPSSAIIVDPYDRSHLYFGNDFGVWFSPDKGENWHPFTLGMPTGALIMDLSISRPEKKIRAVTHGLGVWERPLVDRDPDEPGEDVDQLQLTQNVPNPFNGRTLISYAIPERMMVRMDLFNIRGQRVKNLVHGILDEGFHYISLSSTGLPSGIYIYRLEAGGAVRSRRLMIIK